MGVIEHFPRNACLFEGVSRRKRIDIIAVNEIENLSRCIVMMPVFRNIPAGKGSRHLTVDRPYSPQMMLKIHGQQRISDSRPQR